MSRPVSIQSEVILEAARKVFMRDGYKASTAKIAREAGVSEGSLFKHFTSKCNLFLAAMEVKSGEASWSDKLMAAAGRGNLRHTLEAAGIELLDNFRNTLPHLMMISSSGVVIPNHEHTGETPPPIRKMEVLSDYFKKEIKTGRMIMESPEVQAHIFLGALAHYAWCETIFNFKSSQPKAYVKTLVDNLLKTTAPSSATKSRKTVKKPNPREARQ